MPMKKLLTLQLIIVTVCFHAISARAQDSVKPITPPAKPVAKTVIYSYKPVGPIDHNHPPINKLVQNVRYAYYRDKTDAQVAAMIYASPASYNQTLDRIYNEYDAKKGIPRAVFNADMVRRYGDPFPSAKPIAPAVAKPVAATQPPATPVQAAATDSAKAIIKAEVSNDKSLNSQYQYLLTKVYNYQQPLIGAFHKNVMDTLNQARLALKNADDKLAEQSKTVDSLQTVAKSADATLSESNNKLNEISLLGIPMAKSTYNLIMWGLVIIFGVIAVVVIGRSGANTREAKYRTQLYNELEEEYKNYKVKANEKEKKLARELQTERNRLDDLLGEK